MSSSPRLDTEWELHRPAVFGAAYRLLGSVAEADDVVQEVWLRAAVGYRNTIASSASSTYWAAPGLFWFMRPRLSGA
ncbi:sigma factor, partial [Nonomuraea sp. NPDC004297]